MPISPEQREQLVSEVKRFATELNLSEDQKGTLQGFLTQAYERLQEYKTQNPNASKEDLVKKIAENRSALRERLVKFLTPEQLKKWDSAMTKAKDFLGQKKAASA
jgi:periplasmic protein CpxP/Spy